MPSHSRLVRSKFMTILKKRNVQVLTGFEVGEVKGNLVKETPRSGKGCKVGGPRAVRVDECVWCTQASAQGTPLYSQNATHATPFGDWAQFKPLGLANRIAL